MVYTIFLTDAGGVEFVDGPNGKTLRMIGTKDAIDPEEKAQSIFIKLATQKGTNKFFIESGFDLKGIIDKSAEVGMYDVAIDRLFEVNISSALAKDSQLYPQIEDFQIYRQPDRTIEVDFKVRTVENQTVHIDQILDVE